MVAEVAALLQTKVLPPETVREALSPLQIATADGAITGVRLALTETVEVVVAEQLLALMTVTE